MLYADKRALETNLQVSLLKIREKELQFYTQNCIAIGTQAALLSGFAYNGIIQVDIPSEAADWLKTLVSRRRCPPETPSSPNVLARGTLPPPHAVLLSPPTGTTPCAVLVRDHRRDGLRAHRCPQQARHHRSAPRPRSVSEQSSFARLGHGMWQSMCATQLVVR